MRDKIFIKTALHYGALCGIGVFLFYIMLHVFGFSVFGSATMLGLWIPVLFIVRAIKFHRQSNLNGYITYKQGLGMGLATTLFSSTLFGLAFYLFGMLYATGLVNDYKIQAEMSLEEGKSLMSEAFYAKAVESIDLVTMSSLAYSESFNKILVGLIISLIAAAVYMRKPQAGIPD